MLDLDLLVIGAGPAGVAAAAEARAAGVARDRILVIERGPGPAAAIRSLYPEAKPVTANYKGVDARCEGLLCLVDCSKADALRYLEEMVARHDIAIRCGEHVFEAVRDAGAIRVRTSGGEYRSRVVVVAVGIFGRPNKPDYPIPRELKDRVHFDVTSAAIAGDDVLVVGGGDSAAEYCRYLIDGGNRVTLSYRRAELTRMCAPNRDAVAALARDGRLALWLGSSLRALSDDAGRPCAELAEGPVERRTFDRVVYALGGTTPAALLRSLGVELDGEAPRVGHGFETNVPGLYLTGDLVAGRKGGSIVSAFNASRRAMQHICDTHLGCRLAPVAVGG
jgi:thioredoxin reductase (NADPH)